MITGLSKCKMILFVMNPPANLKLNCVESMYLSHTVS